MAGLPVEALTDRFAVSYAPSGTLFAWLETEREDKHAGMAAAAKAPPNLSNLSLLAVGDPARGRAAPRNEHACLPIPGARLEVEAIARIFRGGAVESNPGSVLVLLGRDASVERLAALAAASRLAAFRFLHFATHAIPDDAEPFRSALVLSPGALVDPLAAAVSGEGAAGGLLTAEQVLRAWKLDAELVVLSGCGTAGRPLGGEGHFGFAQALFLAGARSVVLSLWKVDDAATALLMARFYSLLLQEGRTKVEALAGAKRWLRNLGVAEARRLAAAPSLVAASRGSVDETDALVGAHPLLPSAAPAGDRPYADPFYWAGFILLGSPK
jgi:CHAT domain-containing protein